MQENIYDSDFEQAYAQIRQEDLQKLENQAKEIIDQRNLNKIKKKERSKNNFHKKIILFFILIIAIILIGKLYLIFPPLLPLTYLLECYIGVYYITRVCKIFFKKDVPQDYSTYEEKNEEILNNFFKKTKIFSKCDFSKTEQVTTAFKTFCKKSYNYSILKNNAYKFFHPLNGKLNDLFYFSNIDLKSSGCSGKHSWNYDCSFTEITLNDCYDYPTWINNKYEKLQLYFSDKKGIPPFFTPELKTKLLNDYKDYNYEIILENKKIYILIDTKNLNHYYYSNFLLSSSFLPIQSIKEYFYEIYKQKKFITELATDILKYINSDSPCYNWDNNVNDITFESVEKIKRASLFSTLLFLLILFCIMVIYGIIEFKKFF